MRSALRALLFLLVFSASGLAQTQPTPEAQQRAQELLTKIRAALGGEKLQALRSLSLNGQFRRHQRNGDTTGELKIEVLAPDRLLKTEDTRPQPLVFVTSFQALNGQEVWLDRKVTRPGSDDGANEITRGQTDRTVTTTGESGSMRGAATGSTTVRTATQPGTNPGERTMLGMRLPTPAGQDSNNDLQKMEDARRTSAQQTRPGARPTTLNNPDLQTLRERQLRRELGLLMFVWLLTPSANFPLNFQHAGEINSPQGVVEAIEISGPEELAGRLFINQATARPTMLSYREIVQPAAGYVVAADGKETPADANQEIAVQFVLADYRNVNGVWLPFHIIKAINGAPVDEWKIEKYKLNPDLKPKRFEKR
ncbi:MAG: hypothetical protein JNJ50_18420 [Acidobacteria bacterium]|mgnify:CR=1 FL=1|nr:hypothetical protein [Acidobacteriota bacterium]